MATVAGLFNTESEAQQAIQSLRNIGIEAGNIGIVANDKNSTQSLRENSGVESGAAAVSGAVGGAVLGGGLGLILTAIGAVAVPIIGPIIAAGPLVAALAGAGFGAATGGLVGVLTEAGISEEDATIYQTGVERGGILVTALVPDGQEAAARAIMQQYGSLEPTNARTMFEADPNYRLGNKGGGSEAIAGGIGAVTGGVLGSVVAGPVGAAAGAAIGGAAGAGSSHVSNNDAGSNVGPMSGAASGAVVGGAIGSVAGPIGTAAGAAIGGATGSYSGEKATEAGAQTVQNRTYNTENTTSQDRNLPDYSQREKTSNLSQANYQEGGNSLISRNDTSSDDRTQYWSGGSISSTENDAIVSTNDSPVARSGEAANIGADNAVEQAGVYRENDSEDIVRNTSGIFRAEQERQEKTADDVMDEGIEEADRMYKRQNIGL